LRLIVGLGNPGAKYETSRHNAGFMLADRLCDAHGIDCTSEGGRALYGQGIVSGVEVTVVKPQTYMNLSGEAVASFVDTLEVPVESVLVAYDDLDLPLGTLRLRRSGGTGGHRGLESIAASLGSTAFERLRLGIGHPREADDEQGTKGVADYVLAPFADLELDTLDKMLERGVAAVETLLSKGIDYAMNNFNSAG